MDKKIVSVETQSQVTDDKNNIMAKILKLFSGKYIRFVILIVLALVGILILLPDTNKVSVKESSSYYTYSNFTTTLQYCSKLEEKLKSVLSSVKGAGNVDVMITVDGSPELVYATDSDEKVSTNSSGTTTSSNSSSPIIVTINGSDNALILTENLPAVKGVIVVSSGANNVSVKIDILNAVSKLLDISVDKISVLKGV